VECLHSAYSKFPPESGSVRIFKIGKNLTKLQPKFDSLLFFGTLCSDVTLAMFGCDGLVVES